MNPCYFPFIHADVLVNDQSSTYSNFVEEEDGKAHCVNCTKDAELDLTSRTDAPSADKINDSTTYCKFVDQHALYYQC